MATKAATQAAAAPSMDTHRPAIRPATQAMAAYRLPCSTVNRPLDHPAAHHTHLVCHTHQHLAHHILRVAWAAQAEATLLMAACKPLRPAGTV